MAITEALQARGSRVGRSVVGDLASAVVLPLVWNAPFTSALPYSSDYNVGYRDGRASISNHGLRLDGHPIRNVFAYAAQGEPIGRVQLFDQSGRPIEIDPDASVSGRRATRTVGCPARNGDVAVYNVFPLDQLRLRRGTCADVDEPDATRPDHPLASVPPVTVVRSPHDQPADPRSAPGPDQRERPGAR